MTARCAVAFAACFVGETDELAATVPTNGWSAARRTIVGTAAWLGGSAPPQNGPHGREGVGGNEFGVSKGECRPEARS
jgi:hypothetical protein